MTRSYVGIVRWDYYKLSARNGVILEIPYFRGWSRIFEEITADHDELIGPNCIAWHPGLSRFDGAFLPITTWQHLPSDHYLYLAAPSFRQTR